MTPIDTRPPAGLWSFLDMLELVAPAFMGAVAHFEGSRLQLVVDHSPEALVHFKKDLDGLISELKQLPISPSIFDQAEHLVELVDSDGISYATIATLAGQLGRGVQMDLNRHVFLCLQDRHASIWKEPERWFGEAIAGRFTDSMRDLRDCGRCLALEQWTASVFHSMRIAEHGLRDLAGRLQVQFKGPIELENWKNIIDAIEKKIRDLEALPKGQMKSDDLQFYSTAASHFFYMKEAWRNHVSHSRSTYDETEALRVVTHVKDFMAAMASRA